MTLAAIAAAASIVETFTRIADDAATYGYWAVLLVVAGDGVFPALPGETAIVAAAVLAAEGSLSLGLVILAGAAGAIAGDSTAYWIGRGGGGPIKRTVTRIAGAERLAAAERMVRRQGPALVFTGRFLPGIRIAINLSCGAGQMGYGRFLLFDALGATLWSAQAALLGYFAGKAFADQLWVAFVVAFAVTGIVAAFVTVKERKRVRAERAAAEAERRAVDAPPQGGGGGTV
ncbi:DedA family protein [Miltoncostaea marina]|uniref:DedA family protein n=1 Tax=Miltoncostaea marina TaxID=2843215 RepID=UPI001C3D70A1|nr:DedA family protein [Miltoncostaea marina]